MNHKKVLPLSLCLCLYLFFLFPVSAAAFDPSLLSQPSAWKDVKEAPLYFGSLSPSNDIFYYWADKEQNCIYLALQFSDAEVTENSVITGELNLDNGAKKWMLEAPSTVPDQGENEIPLYSDISINKSTNYLVYTIALALPDPGAYTLLIHYQFNSHEIRVTAPITFDTAPPVTIKETTSKVPATTKAAADKPTTSVKQKSTGAKSGVSTNEKNAVKSKAAVKTADGDKTESVTETIGSADNSVFDLMEEKSFFQKMSKSTRAVFIVSILFGLIALLVVGIAIGRKTGGKVETSEKQDEE